MYFLHSDAHSNWEHAMMILGAAGALLALGFAARRLFRSGARTNGKIDACMTSLDEAQKSQEEHAHTIEQRVESSALTGQHAQTG